MRPEEAMQRAAVVAEAKTWLGTPYHPEGRIKGAGVDCATIIYATYRAAGLAPEIDIAHYPHDWHLHRGTERYLSYILPYAREVAGPPQRMPQPGDIVMWRFGRCFSHGAIVVAWPRIIHAFVKRPVGYEDADRATYLISIGENGQDQGQPRPRRFFTLASWEG